MGLSVMQQRDSSLEVKFEMESWIGEMRMGRSTINGGKRRMETSKAMVERNDHLTLPRKMRGCRDVEKVESKDDVYGVWG